MAEAIVSQRHYDPIITLDRRGRIVRIPRYSTRLELLASRFVTHNGSQVVDSAGNWVIRENS